MTDTKHHSFELLTRYHFLELIFIHVHLFIMKSSCLETKLVSTRNHSSCDTSKLQLENLKSRFLLPLQRCVPYSVVCGLIFQFCDIAISYFLLRKKFLKYIVNKFGNAIFYFPPERQTTN